MVQDMAMMMDRANMQASKPNPKKRVLGKYMHGMERTISPKSVKKPSELPPLTSIAHTRVSPTPIPNINWDVAGNRRCQINRNVETKTHCIENKTRCQRG